MSRLEAKDLRIGNYFEVPKMPYLGLQKVQAITSKWINGIDVNIISPIPLTEEHLIRFGFDNVRKNMLMCHNEYHNNRINEGAFYVEPVGDAFNHWYLYHKVKMITSNIRYVHQLQNLYFALCGEELELK